MYNFIEYSNNYSITLGSLWQYYRDEIVNTIKNSESFKSNIRITGKATADDDDNVNDVKITIPLKHLSNFWRILEKSLISSKINLNLT